MRKMNMNANVLLSSLNLIEFSMLLSRRPALPAAETVTLLIFNQHFLVYYTLFLVLFLLSSEELSYLVYDVELCDQYDDNDQDDELDRVVAYPVDDALDPGSEV